MKSPTPQAKYAKGAFQIESPNKLNSQNIKFGDKFVTNL